MDELEQQVLSQICTLMDERLDKYPAEQRAKDLARFKARPDFKELVEIQRLRELDALAKALARPPLWKLMPPTGSVYGDN